MSKSHRTVRTILKGMLTIPELVAAIQPHWGIPGLFESPEANHIASAAVAHYVATGEVLNKEPGWLDSLASTGMVSEAEIESTAAFWEDVISTRKTTLATALKAAEEYFDKVRLQRLSEQIESLTDKGKIREAYELVNEYSEPIALQVQGDLEEASLKDITIMRYLFKPMLAYGYITLFEGESSTGKSTIICDIAARIANGHNMPPKTARPAKNRKGKNVLYITSEDGWGDLMLPRLKAAGYNFDGEHKIYGWPSDLPPIQIPRDIRLLRDKIKANDIKLVIFDPIISLMEDRFNDSNSAGHVRRVMDPLNKLAQECRVAFLGVRHFTKSANGNSAMHRGSGSGAWTQACRFQWFNVRHADDWNLFALVPSKVNTVADPMEYSMLYRIASKPVNIKGKVEQYGAAQWVKRMSSRDQSKTADEWMYGKSKAKATY